MDLRNADCLEEMKNIDDNSIDLLFCDLPYTTAKFGKTTSCKWDCEIDLDLFWKQVNRICRNDTPMIFTCSTKFGNCLINSNPKNFRYDMVWVKTRSCNFLNAKKMPMKKHEMVYVFYRKIPKVYTENIEKHHTHKFLKKENTIINRDNSESVYGTEKGKVFIKDEDGKLRNSEPRYEPPLPNSVIKEEENSNKNSEVYGSIKDNGYYKKRKNGEGNAYDPPLPNSVIKEEDNTNKNSEVYGSIKGNGYNSKQRKENVYEPPLPNSVIKEDPEYENRIIKPRKTIKKEENYGKEYLDKKINFRKYNKKLGGKGEESHLYDPPLPNSVIKEEDNVYTDTYKNDIYNVKRDKNRHKKENINKYEPSLPNSVLEVKSEGGKHSTQKPVALMEWILKYYSKENDIILDATMGSGSMGEACKNMNRKFIGIEKDKDIYEVAFNRLIT